MIEKPPSISVDNFDSQFPGNKFDSGTRWTKQGSAENLNALVAEAAEDALRGEPSTGVIKFERLPDGGYQIKYFKSRE